VPFFGPAGEVRDDEISRVFTVIANLHSPCGERTGPSQRGDKKKRWATSPGGRVMTMKRQKDYWQKDETLLERMRY
jgi:hypothetical protein